MIRPATPSPKADISLALQRLVSVSSFFFIIQPFSAPLYPQPPSLPDSLSNTVANRTIFYQADENEKPRTFVWRKDGGRLSEWHLLFVFNPDVSF